MATAKHRGPQAKPFKLTSRERVELHGVARSGASGRIQRRALALLALDRKEPIQRVALLLNCSRQSVTDWRDAWLRSRGRHRPQVLQERERSGRPREWDQEDREALLLALLDRSPDQFGYRAWSWTSRLLSHRLAEISNWKPSDRTVRRELKALGYVYKRPRYVLDPDPEFAKNSP